MTDAASVLAGCLPKDPTDHGPFAVPSVELRSMLSELLTCRQIITNRQADIAPELASAAVWSLFDDWQRDHTDITCEMGYDTPDEEIENRRQALIALFGPRSSPAEPIPDGGT